jgi:ketosteroid isomerase-like protein
MSPQVSTRGQRRRHEASVRKNVKASYSGFKLWEAGDIDGLIRLYGPQAKLWHLEGWPEPGPTVGRAAIRRQFNTLREGWTDISIDVEEIEGRDDWVVARVRWSARGEESGVTGEVRYSAATRFVGGLIVEVHYCWAHEDALRAAGWLPDEGGDQGAGKPASE